MSFHSPLFLFLFLPVFALVYAASRPGWRNAVLLAASLFFYSWGEPVFVWVVLVSSWLDFLVGKKVLSSTDSKIRRRWVALAVVLNAGLLVYFKYTGFLAQSFGSLLDCFGVPFSPALQVALPIGISFIVFEKITYVVDIHRGKGCPAASFHEYLLYVLFFPKLMAGPIIKYHDIAGQLCRRQVGWEDLREGTRRIAAGFAKKALLADTLGVFADQVFAEGGGRLDAVSAWVGVLSFALQIYFDFSGYSDMAIGLARCFGFRLLENFNQPYLARSFTDFWRRWHISLSSWIREYLYIPLGGNRGTVARTHLNLWICFLLSGLWHGASWMFVIWGVYHGTMLVLERTRWGQILGGLPAGLNRLVTFVLLVVGWIPFRSGSLEQTCNLVSSLFSCARVTRLEVTGETIAFLGLGLVVCFWGTIPGTHRIARLWSGFRWQAETTVACSILLFWGAAAKTASSAAQTFIYFRF
jgi:alginate O-acetyltransferase complex protein AlgI